MLQFSQKHGSVFGFVVQFETFKEIFVTTLLSFFFDLQIKIMTLETFHIVSHHGGSSCHSLEKRWEEILRTSISSVRVLWCRPSFQSIARLGWDSMSARHFRCRRHRCFSCHHNRRWRRRIQLLYPIIHYYQLEFKKKIFYPL